MKTIYKDKKKQLKNQANKNLKKSEENIWTVSWKGLTRTRSTDFSGVIFRTSRGFIAPRDILFAFEAELLGDWKTLQLKWHNL